jgi:hypothetical protein
VLAKTRAIVIYFPIDSEQGTARERYLTESHIMYLTLCMQTDAIIRIQTRYPSLHARPSIELCLDTSHRHTVNLERELHQRRFNRYYKIVADLVTKSGEWKWHKTK